MSNETILEIPSDPNVLSLPSFPSPRSSTSSAQSLPPLTPSLEISMMSLSEFPLSTTASPSHSNIYEDLDTPSKHPNQHILKHNAVQPTSTLSHNFPLTPSSHTTSDTSDTSDVQEEGIKKDFTFGDCCSTPQLPGTPTAQDGIFFEYPFRPNPEPPTFVPSLHRRGSLAERVQGLHSTYVVGDGRRGSIPTPPGTRRSSTCSTISTIPITGRRPSILHSATVPPSPVILPAELSPQQHGSSINGSFSGTWPGRGVNGLRGNPNQNQPRRSSILFPQKLQVTPIPPSLLNRRGSLPVQQLNFEASQRGFTTSSVALYKRKESEVMGAKIDEVQFGSNGEVGTGVGMVEGLGRRHSMRPHRPAPINSNGRRPSLPSLDIPQNSSIVTSSPLPNSQQRYTIRPRQSSAHQSSPISSHLRPIHSSSQSIHFPVSTSTPANFSRSNQSSPHSNLEPQTGLISTGKLRTTLSTRPQTISSPRSSLSGQTTLSPRTSLTSLPSGQIHSPRSSLPSPSVSRSYESTPRSFSSTEGSVPEEDEGTLIENNSMRDLVGEDSVKKGDNQRGIEEDVGRRNCHEERVRFIDPWVKVRPPLESIPSDETEKA
ncbi:hypothetical protein TREMEDRAFT_59533 [Tremella mesenterica DSM 1558]|uniref:uncharacterized protein n=1 Tax=Tremella mesenterica (strain ATCC 24925 / CBS 8224 / DSM 1558 / NBRC 9311 / NRRL Y-6157 / RJB 2259-6 / UBC 559-6) TaxID=578456 RepID=UPI0003F4A272|nr:uncharacterized protein TREMEDRAFT_59533 [Tremella mesenterica DSM 1558]EIW73368.1 hypothetical protein TREMEDRAFT_59533 [Tremella mesenterica DSM 1558]